MPYDGTPRILITRLSHIGDCVLTLPLLCALRRRYPSAYIVWAVERPADQLLYRHPDLDQVIVVPRNWLRRPIVAARLRRELREHRLDVAIDPQSLTKSSALARLSGARIRLGMARPDGREISPWLNNRLAEITKSHLVDKTLEMLQSINCADDRVEFRLPIDQTALAEMASWCSQIPGQSFIAINPGGSWTSKRWEPERFAAVARQALDRWHLRSLVVWAGDAERQMAQSIVNASGGAAKIAPPTNLNQLAALLFRAKMYLGGDSGPMHIAAAVGTPCVALFGPTKPEDSGPYGQGHENIQAWYQSGNCRQRRSAANDAMRAIQVPDVLAAIEKIIRRRTSAPYVA
jgi:ADP-heptose:LPS heptosyltransferase